MVDTQSTTMKLEKEGRRLLSNLRFDATTSPSSVKCFYHSAMPLPVASQYILIYWVKSVTVTLNFTQ